GRRRRRGGHGGRGRRCRRRRHRGARLRRRGDGRDGSRRRGGRLGRQQVLHLLDEPRDLIALGRREVRRLTEVLLKVVDRLLGSLQLLEAAPEVAQVDRVAVLREQLGEQIGRLLVATGGEVLTRLALALVQRRERRRAKTDGSRKDNRERDNPGRAQWWSSRRGHPPPRTRHPAQIPRRGSIRQENLSRGNVPRSATCSVPFDFHPTVTRTSRPLLLMSGLYSALFSMAFTRVAWFAKGGAIAGALVGGLLAYLPISRLLRAQGAMPQRVAVRRTAGVCCLVWGLVLPPAFATAGFLWGLAHGLGNVVEGPLS